MKKYIMAIDQGTTSSRAIIYNEKLEIIAKAQREFTQYFPHSGWVEHDPEEIWQSVQSVISDSLISGEIDPALIATIGITNQRETTVIWDKKTGKAVYKAIVWQSRQSADYAEKLKVMGKEEWIHQRTGLVVDAYFSATKIQWILDHIENGHERAENGELLFGTIDTWLLWKLTNGACHLTDYTNASRTMLFNATTLTWDDDILELLNIPKKMLPKICSNTEVYGKTSSYHFSGNQVPISGMAGDQQAALVGQMAFSKGDIKSTYGTGAFIVMNVGDELKLSQHKLLSTIAYKIKGELSYALEGSIFVAGSAIQWLRDGLKIMEQAKDSEEMAKKAKKNDVYIVPAFTGLGAPYWNSNARGAMFGLTRGTTREDIAKATLQAIAYQVKDVVLTMEKDTNLSLNTLKVDGGAANNNFLMQFQSDILEAEVVRPSSTETTSLGAAVLAGLGIGMWESLDEVTHLVQTDHIFKPQMSKEENQRLYKGWQQAVKATQVFSEN